MQFFLRESVQHLVFAVARESTSVRQGHRRAGRAALSLQVDRIQLQAGHPAVRHFVQGASLARIDLSQVFAQEALRFACGKFQVPQVESGKLALRAQSPQREGQRAARRERQVQLRWCMVEQPLDRLENARVVEPVQVVEHQHQRPPTRGDGLHQGDDTVLDRSLVDIGVDQQRCLPDQRGVHLRDAGQQAA
ncbi:hypothetical protein D3C85_1168830 [compost metagenome]